MSKSVFDKVGDIRNNINRSTFDWSHTNNFTTGFGRITPVLCELCPPASSLKIKPDFGLQFMPLQYPVQTKMKAYLSFYRVPLRTLWKDYMDFTSGIPNSTFEPPYIKFPVTSFGEKGALRVSSLADYFGVPVTSPNAEVNLADAKVRSIVHLNSGSQFTTYGSIRTLSNNPASNQELNFAAINGSPTLQHNGTTAWIYIDDSMFRANNLDVVSILDTFPSVSVNSNYEVRGKVVFRLTGGNVRNAYSAIKENPSSCRLMAAFRPKSNFTGTLPLGAVKGEWNLGSQSNARIIDYDLSGADTDYIDLEFDFRNLYNFSELNFFKNSYLEGTQDKEEIRGRFFLGFDYSQTFFVNSYDADATQSNDNYLVFGTDTKPDNQVIAGYLMNGNASVSELTKETCPYDFEGGSTTKNLIKLSAYPFRAYEAIYNAYIRNTRNNPFKLDGKPVYNRWITTDEGGSDTKTPLNCMQANWASDAFTTALTAPQQGKAPLVGITTYADTRTDENGHTVSDMKFAVVDEDGKKYGLTFVSNDTELKDVKYTELSNSKAVSPVSSLFDLATSGISINDFRNVNAYQRYLELNQFRGFSYKEIIEGRFDVNVKYDALNMPEYLGGITRDVIVNPVTQNVETSNLGTYSGALGSQAGIAGVRGNSDGSISVYCDEESLVIGIISVCPMPIYTQSLPKHFLYRDRLDSYTPEFDHIGYQPIGLSELCPVLDFVSNGKNTNATFGYQRPWYEYVQKRDTAHGIFRTQLRNFLVNRVFSGVPSLGAKFTTIDEMDVNQIFSVTETTDKIFGQIYFDITAKLPISRVVVPKLE